MQRFYFGDVVEVHVQGVNKLAKILGPSISCRGGIETHYDVQFGDGNLGSIYVDNMTLRRASWEF